MGINNLESIDLGNYYYGLRDKMQMHIIKRSEECFKKAEERRNSIKTKEEFEAYIEEMRDGFIERLGGLPYDNSLPLNAEIKGVIEEPGLKIEKVIFQSRPNVYVTANLYLPENRKEPCGAVLFQQGHANNGKADDQYQRICRGLASCGLIVMLMDPVGQGERHAYYEKSIGRRMISGEIYEHQYLGQQCVLVGDSVARYFIADAMRAVDYLISRPEVDENKIGITGSSGGGTATCHTMVCDKRIKAAAPCIFVTTRRHYLYAGGVQDSEQIWLGATEAGFDHFECALCFAPKPLLILSVDADFFPIEGAEEVYNVSKRFWEMYGAGDKLNRAWDKSEHSYTNNLASAACKFFAKHLNGEEKQADITKMSYLPESQTRCTKTGRIKDEYSDAKFVYDENRERYHNLETPVKPLSEFLKEKMFKDRKSLPFRIKEYNPTYYKGLKVTPLLWFPQEELPNSGLRIVDFEKEPTETVLCLWDNGTNRIEEHIYKIRKMCREGKAVIIIDVSCVGKCMPFKTNTGRTDKDIYGTVDRVTKELYFLGDSLCALRLYEIDYIINAVKKIYGEKVSLYTEGLNGVVAKLYKEVNPDIEVTVSEDLPTYKELIESKYYEDYNLFPVLMPGIARYFK